MLFWCRLPNQPTGQPSDEPIASQDSTGHVSKCDDMSRLVFHSWCFTKQTQFLDAGALHCWCWNSRNGLSHLVPVIFGSLVFIGVMGWLNWFHCLILVFPFYACFPTKRAGSITQWWWQDGNRWHPSWWNAVAILISRFSSKIAWPFWNHGKRILRHLQAWAIAWLQLKPEKILLQNLSTEISIQKMSEVIRHHYSINTKYISSLYLLANESSIYRRWLPRYVTCDMPRTLGDAMNAARTDAGLWCARRSRHLQ